MVWITIDGFEITLDPVTNAQYAAWLKSLPPEEAVKRYSPLMEEHFWGGILPDYTVKAGFEKKPVVFVSWFDAQAFAQWHGWRLPTAREWKKAAAWLENEGRLAEFAHGKDVPPAQTEANVYDSELGWALPAPHLADVDAYPPSGPYSLRQMAGNVAEWVDGECAGWQPALGGSLFRTAGFAALDAGEADAPEKRLSTFSFRVARGGR